MIKEISRTIGRLWGRTFLRYIVLEYTRYRVSLFNIEAVGAQHISNLGGKSYILVSNHVLPRDTMLRILGLKCMDRFNHAIDSFALQQIAYQYTGTWPRVVAKYGRDRWYQLPPLRFLQRYVRQPLTQGQLEGVGYLPVDLKDGAMNRDFLHEADLAVRSNIPLIIFPEGNTFSEFERDRGLRQGAAHLACKYGIDVLPAYIACGCDTWQPGASIYVSFGPPISVANMNKPQVVQEMKRAIVELQTSCSTHSSIRN